MNKKGTVGLILIMTLLLPLSLFAQEQECEWCKGKKTDPPGIDKPTAINLESFSVERRVGAATLLWITGAEVNNEGFNIFRAEALSGPFTRINQFLIPAKGLIGGASYSFIDTAIEDGKSYFYRIEDIDNTGASNAHHTISVNPILSSSAGPQAQATPYLSDSPLPPTPTVSSAERVPDASVGSSVNRVPDTILMVPHIMESSHVVDTTLLSKTPDQDDPLYKGEQALPTDNNTLSTTEDLPTHDHDMTASGMEASPLKEPSGQFTSTPKNLPKAGATSLSTVTFAYSLEELNGNRLSVAKDSGTARSGEEINISFRAFGDDGSVNLEWYSDEATYGFNIWRSEGEDGKYVQVNDAMISLMDVGEKHKERVSYIYIDKGVGRGKTYSYVLMKVSDYKGEAVYFGPVQAAPRPVISSPSLMKGEGKGEKG